MALISPILDDRSYDQLRDELIKRIPVYTREWTDHNESDPGIALLELFAYLGESLLYRFNQIPDTTKIEFLRLLGVRPRPAQPAHVFLAATTELPEGVQALKGTEAKAGAVTFQSDDEVYVWPLDAVCAGKTAVQAADPNNRADVERRADALARLKLTTDSPAQFYETTVIPPDPLAPDATSLDVSCQMDHALWIALLRKPTTDLTKLRDKTLFVGVIFDETIPQPFDLEKLNQAGAGTFRSTGLTADRPPVLWELWQPPATKTTQPTFRTLDVLGDTTGGMVTTGVVKLALPHTLPGVPATTEGTENYPPPLPDDKQAKNVVGWLRVRRPTTNDYADGIHRIAWVGLNAVSATQAQTAAAELLGSGTGDSDQTYRLIHQPVLPNTVHLQVEQADGWHDWQEVDTFVDLAAGAYGYTVDYQDGVVSFGRDRVPQIGERIRVLSYRYGGGKAGNVAAKAVTALSGIANVKVSNLLPAAGGADAVSLANALDAVPAEVHRHDRAVTVEDFRDLAAQVPRVARAEALPNLHPDTPLVRAAGVVSVVIFPDSDLRDPNAPSPDASLLRRVAAYLDKRRLVTTELYVIPPTYRKISVSVGARVRTGYQVDAVRRWVELIVRQYLAPLPPYGPDGGGWPLGRAVRRAELEAVAVQVDGVEYLEGQGLRLAVPAPSPNGPTETELVQLQQWEVPELVDITVVAGDPLPPGTSYPPTQPSTTVIVPLPPDVC